MNKSSSDFSQQKFSLDDGDLLTHPTIEWIIEKKKILLWGLSIFVVFLILASRLLTWRSLNAESDFFQAQNAFARFEKNQFELSENSEAESSLKELTAIMERRPELKPKYQGPLAQGLLVHHQIPQAESFATDIFKRTEKENLDLFRTYTKSSFLIGQGNFEEAIKTSEELKHSLSQSNQEDSFLNIFNLIRIAFLYQETGQKDKEMKTWEEVQNLGLRSKSFLAAAEILKIGPSTLDQYINIRKNL